MPAAKTATKTVTKWDALQGVAPTKVVCETYAPVHAVALGCHTSLPLTPDSLLTHTVERGHGGGFHFRLAPGNTSFWSGVQDLGLEVVDWRCAVCGSKVRPVAAVLLKHMVPHMNRNRVMEEGGLFYVTLSTTPPPPDDLEE